MQASNAHIGIVSGDSLPVQVTLTRTADANVYTAGDAIANATSAAAILAFAGAGRLLEAADPILSGYITKMRLVTSQSTCVAQIRLWFFRTATPFINNDNAAFLIKLVDQATRLGYYDLPALATEAGSDCAIAQILDARMAYKAAADGYLYVAVQTKTAFTPASAQTFLLELTFERN